MKLFILVLSFCVFSLAATFREPANSASYKTFLGLNGVGFGGAAGPTINPYKPLQSRRRCPICDSSVYSYCGNNLFHDSCCCNNPNNPYEELPYQCNYADCSFLHANSCREHELITACCCTK